MTGAYRVRLAVAADVPALARAEDAAAGLFAGHPLGERFRATPTAPADYFAAIAERRLFAAVGPGGGAVGYALAGEVGANAHLEEVSVHPDHGRRGVGEALVGAVFEWARARGHRAITLTTLESVPWNAPWYRKLGFRALAPEELTVELRALLAREAERGIGRAPERVAMRKELE
jgi:GNAT superfamily N-acetyltransferase